VRSRFPFPLAVAALLVVALAVPTSAAARGANARAAGNANHGVPLIAREPTPEQLANRPEQPTSQEAAEAVEAASTTASQCFGNDDTLVVTIGGFDPDNPLTQDVVFFRETPEGSPDSATLWVAWDFLTTDYGRLDEITCDQLEYLQSKMDDIVDTDVEFFGTYNERPVGNANIDIMIYNIVDESYFDPDFGSYIAGFFGSGYQDVFNRNMVFIDTYDWANRLGPNTSDWRPDDGAGNDRPYLYEGTVAHELQHLIHNDHDSDEESWIDEGLADLAQLVNGFGHDEGHVVYYLAFHRTSLTLWGSQLEDYGAAYLFQVYLAEQFAGLAEEYNSGSGALGDVLDPAWTRALVEEDLNSIAGVEAAASAFAGSPVHFADLYDSWMLANFLDEPDRMGDHGGWPLGYQSIDLRPYVTDSFSPWSIERSIKDVYGSDHHGDLPTSRYYGGYISGTVEYPIGALPPYTALYGTFKGAQPNLDVWLRGEEQSGVLPDDGLMELASGGGHLLTDRWVELGPVNATLDFRTWFNIEEDWDFGFVEIEDPSNPFGWTKLEGTITRHSDNPFTSTAWGNAGLAGQDSVETAITGSSMLFDDTDGTADGWVDAHFDIPAGLEGNTVRLNYYTDDAYNDEGWFVDAVMIDGGPSYSFEDGADQPAGFDASGWSITTGLFTNDWVGAYVTPVYERGKLDHTDVGYLADPVTDDGNQYVMGTVDTNSLNRDEAMIAFANRPGESPFDSNYLFLPKKLNNGHS
jgi:hypothetical protein